MINVKELNHVFDYKKAITTTFDDVLHKFTKDYDGSIKTIGPDSQLLIITQNAYIQGKINHFTHEEEENNKYFFSEGLTELGSRLESLPETMTALNVTAPLHLKDVTISPILNPDQQRQLDEMVLFTDQIVGLSII
ncbi:hypothetical protein [Fictibacillus phosphorivorans]|uniref:hypothetical protein n=1 Tax=Fictibacillus phosphorivorans TaxID=1221500 RepID=UPI0035E7B3F2